LIDQHYKSKQNVQYSADQLNITLRILNNVNYDIAQYSAKVLIDKITILQIKRLLINTPYSIKEIAYQHGFNEPTKILQRSTDLTSEAFIGSYSRAFRFPT